jgi:hypothetical protein
MEGIFYLDMFKNSIFPQNVNSYIENYTKWIFCIIQGSAL